MMQGKPMKLVSEFRLTYSMILNLLRVERLRVEDMMMRSFSEVDRHRKEKTLKTRLEDLLKKKQNLTSLRSGLASGQTAELEAFYHIATDYLKIKEKNWNLLLSQQGVAKSLIPGRVILVNFKNETNIPCALLNVDQSSHEKTFSVITLKNLVELKEDQTTFEDYLSLANPAWESFGFASSDHCVLNIKSSAIGK